MKSIAILFIEFQMALSHNHKEIVYSLLKWTVSFIEYYQSFIEQELYFIALYWKLYTLYIYFLFEAINKPKPEQSRNSIICYAISISYNVVLFKLLLI